MKERRGYRLGGCFGEMADGLSLWTLRGGDLGLGIDLGHYMCPRSFLLDCILPTTFLWFSVLRTFTTNLSTYDKIVGGEKNKWKPKVKYGHRNLYSPQVCLRRDSTYSSATYKQSRIVSSVLNLSLKDKDFSGALSPWSWRQTINLFFWWTAWKGMSKVGLSFDAGTRSITKTFDWKALKFDYKKIVFLG